MLLILGWWVVEPAFAQALPPPEFSVDTYRRADAQLRLAELFEQGSGVAIDLTRARMHYGQSALAGSETAKLRLGQMLIAGQGGSKDVPAGLKLLREVASSGNVLALVSLGDALSGGALGYVDAEGAIAAYRKASNAGNVEAMVRLADVFQAGEIVAADLRQSFDYYQAAAAAGSVSAALAAMEMLAAGRGVPQDATKGMAALRRAMAAGSADAAMALGDLLLNGDAGLIDVDGALQAYEAAAAGGRSQGYLRLGDIFRDGYYVPRDGKRAVDYYQLAADAGETFGLYALGAGYLDRDFGSLGSAVQGMDLVQHSGSQYAVTAIAEAYFHGQGVDPDIGRGLAILAEAATAGNTTAALELVALYRDGLRRGARLLLLSNHKRAHQQLQAVEAQIDRGSYLYQSLLLEAARAVPDDPARLVERLAELSLRDRRSLVSRLLSVNANSFVAVVQVRLRELGYLSGGTNGRLDRRTIRAINAYCAFKAAQQVCRPGPLSAAAAQVLSGAF